MGDPVTQSPPQSRRSKDGECGGTASGGRGLRTLGFRRRKAHAYPTVAPLLAGRGLHYGRTSPSLTSQGTAEAQGPQGLSAGEGRTQGLDGVRAHCRQTGDPRWGYQECHLDSSLFARHRALSAPVFPAQLGSSPFY